MIRSDEQASRRSKVKLCAGVGAVVCVELEPVKAHAMVIRRLTTGRWNGGVRGLGRAVRSFGPCGHAAFAQCGSSGCALSAGASQAGSRQRRRSTVEVGESRWREGRQEIGMSR